MRRTALGWRSDPAARTARIKPAGARAATAGAAAGGRTRRRTAFLLAAAALLAAAPAPYPAVRPGIHLAFPADGGAHPAFRTEWWYVTGALRAADGGRPIGFQITFFRTRPAPGPAPGSPGANPSAFAPRQVLFAHAALSDPAVGHILHGERAARAGFGLAGARVGDADVAIRDWRFRRLPDGRYAGRVATDGFALDLVFRPTQPVLAEGRNGYSRKGPLPTEASYYYSVPHLAASGTVVTRGRPVRVTGEAWLDREWSSNYLAPGAAGWDWTGINLDDGGALMAFRIRRRGAQGGSQAGAQDGPQNGTQAGALWAGGSYRAPDGRVTVLAPGDVRFVPLATWRSPATGATYPVAERVDVRLPGGVRSFTLRPIFPDQELDSRASGLPVYWEGLVTAAGTGGTGRGYLELTGYAAPLRM